MAMTKRLKREDVVFSITILQDNIEHLESMLKDRGEAKKNRYANSTVSAPNPDTAKMLQGRMESLIRTKTWMERKVAQYDAAQTGEQQ